MIEGASGGGGVVLATAHLRPDLSRAVLAEVPLADILDTELDFTMPYALQETAEYGDPHIAHGYRHLAATTRTTILAPIAYFRRRTLTPLLTTAKCSFTSLLATSRSVGLARPIATRGLSSACGWWAATAALHMDLV